MTVIYYMKGIFAAEEDFERDPVPREEAPAGTRANGHLRNTHFKNSISGIDTKALKHAKRLHRSPKLSHPSQ